MTAPASFYIAQECKVDFALWKDCKTKYVTETVACKVKKCRKTLPFTEKVGQLVLSHLWREQDNRCANKINASLDAGHTYLWMVSLQSHLWTFQQDFRTNWLNRVLFSKQSTFPRFPPSLIIKTHTLTKAFRFQTPHPGPACNPAPPRAQTALSPRLRYSHLFS